MPAPILLGQSHFPSLMRDGRYYVDKSGFAVAIVKAPAQVMLFPRPRRFGKTLNLSMLQTFFEPGPDRAAMFANLAVWADPDARAHFQRHPVVALSFKDVKPSAWSGAWPMLRELIVREVSRHRSACVDRKVPADVRERLKLAARGEDVPSVLRDLCHALSIHHGELAVVLIDEYDACVLNAWEHGHYDEAVGWFRSLLSPGLKDNPFLYKGVLTGILRVSKESMFSDLNNVKVYSLLSAAVGEHFGFTEPEVLGMLAEFGRAGEAEQARGWYNGYRFGETTVYNPWSVMNMLAGPREPLQAYWVNTSSNALARSLLLENAELSETIEVLLQGGSFRARVAEDIALRDLTGENVWSLLLFSGYLRADEVEFASGAVHANLRIPNLEVRGVWVDTFREWIDRRSAGVSRLHAAMLAGDAPGVQGILARMLEVHVSTHDVKRDQDEAFYHAFVLGLLVTLEETHTVRSNREVGRGRADLQVIPRRPGLPGLVVEFNRRHGAKDLATTAAEALVQIGDRRYSAELEAAGASPVHRLGIAFGGKEVAVCGG